MSGKYQQPSTIECLQVSLKLCEVEAFKRLPRLEHFRRENRPSFIAVGLVKLRRHLLNATPRHAFQVRAIRNQGNVMTFYGSGARHDAPRLSGIEPIHRRIRELDADTHDSEQIKRIEKLVQVAQLQGDVGSDFVPLTHRVYQAGVLPVFKRVASIGSLVGGIVSIFVKRGLGVVAGYGAVILDCVGAGKFRRGAAFQSPQHRFVISAREDAIARAFESLRNSIVRAVAEHLPGIRPDEFLMAEMFRMRGKRLCGSILRKQKVALVIRGGLFAEFEICFHFFVPPFVRACFGFPAVQMLKARFAASSAFPSNHKNGVIFFMAFLLFHSGLVAECINKSVHIGGVVNTAR